MQTSFKKYFTLSFLVVSTFFAAHACSEPTIQDLPKCNADAKKALRGMCMYVSRREYDPHAQGRYRFLYQKKMFEAACVDRDKDSDEAIAVKVSRVWAEHEKNLVCSGVQFDLEKGSLLKFAVSNNFNEFISDAIQWKVNLNKVDEADGKTLLDYTAEKLKRNGGGPLEFTLKMYYENLREAGAKHASEL